MQDLDSSTHGPAKIFHGGSMQPPLRVCKTCTDSPGRGETAAAVVLVQLSTVLCHARSESRGEQVEHSVQVGAW